MMVVVDTWKSPMLFFSHCSIPSISPSKLAHLTYSRSTACNFERVYGTFSQHASVRWSLIFFAWQELNELNPTKDPAFSPLLEGDHLYIE